MEAPPRRGTFFSLQVYEWVGISLVELYQRVGKSAIAVCEKDLKELTDILFLWLWKRQENFMVK